MSLAAHIRTIWPVVSRVAGRPSAPASEPWTVDLPDPDIGSVRLTGRLRRRAGENSSTLLLLVHGLGGSSESTCMLCAASMADAFGLSTLRLNLRGADGLGEDFYHAGLSSDLESVLASTDLAGFERILVLGFSLGGHISLRLATEMMDPRLRAAAAVCSPLDLDRNVEAIDKPGGWLYRRYVLAGLSKMYAEVAERRELPLPVADARRVRTIREWDRVVIAPRFGFDSPEDYYHQAGVGRRLDRLRVPAMLVVVEEDPMISHDAVLSVVNGDAERLLLRSVRRGGHLALPANLDLGEDAPPGIYGQAIGWLLRQ